MKTHIFSFIAGALVAGLFAVFLWPNTDFPQQNNHQELTTPSDLYFSDTALYDTLKEGPFSALKGSFLQTSFLKLYPQQPTFEYSSYQPFKKACISKITETRSGPKVSFAFTLFDRERAELLRFLEANPDKSYITYVNNEPYPISGNKEAVAAYRSFETEAADLPDLIFKLKLEQLGSVLEIYQRFFPHQPPRACDETVILTTLPHWNTLMDQMWGKYNY